MKKILLISLMLLSFFSVSKVNAQQVLPNFPLLKPIVWDWSKINYLEENNEKNKQKISNEFVKILKEEEDALNLYLSKNNSVNNKSKAFLKHMNNVDAVSKNLAQVVDWIVFDNENLPEPKNSSKVIRELYGIKYIFKAGIEYDEGEKFYSYSANPIKLVDFPMVEMKYEYVGTELHATSKLNKEYYIKKYSDKLDQSTIIAYKNLNDLSKIDYSEENVIGKLITIVIGLISIIFICCGVFFIKKFGLINKIKTVLPEKINNFKQIFSPKINLLKEKTQTLLNKIFNIFKRKELIIGLCIIFGIIASVIIYNENALPKCDSKFAEETIIEIFKNNDNTYENNIQRVGEITVSNFTPVSYDKNIGKYECSAYLVMYPKNNEKLYYLFPLSKIRYDLEYEIYKERGRNSLKARWRMAPIEPEDIDRR